MKEPQLWAGFVTRQTIDRIGIRIKVISKFTKVGVTVLMLDQRVLMSVLVLDRLQPLSSNQHQPS